MTDTPNQPSEVEQLRWRVAALELDRDMHRTKLNAIEQQLLSISEVLAQTGTFSDRAATTFEKLAEHINVVSGKVNVLRADLDAVARR